MKSLAIVRLLLAALLIAVATAALPASEPKTLLFIGQSPDNHPRGTHEYMGGVELLARQVEPTEGLKLRIAKADEPWPQGPAMIDAADGVVLFLSEGAQWTVADPKRFEALQKLAARGGGLVALHWAMGTRASDPIEPFLRLLGGCHGGPDRKYQVVETELVVERSHPIVAGLENFLVRDEFYYQLKFVTASPAVRPVLSATIDGRRETVAWSWERPDGGRSFGFSGLHFHDNWELPQYRKFLTAAVLWTLKLPRP